MNHHFRSFTLVAILALSGCSQGKSVDGEGRVELALTNAPLTVVPVSPFLDLSSVAHVYVTLQEVDVHVAPAWGAQGQDVEHESAGGWSTLPLPADPTIDLMALQGSVPARLSTLFPLPVGKITQIRLILDKQGDNRVVLVSGVNCALDLSGVPATGIKINHPLSAIDVEDGKNTRVVLSVDIERSLVASGGCSYELAPIIKVESIEHDDVDDDTQGGPIDTGTHGDEEKAAHSSMGH